MKAKCRDIFLGGEFWKGKWKESSKDCPWQDSLGFQTPKPDLKKDPQERQETGVSEHPCANNEVPGTRPWAWSYLLFQSYREEFLPNELYPPCPWLVRVKAKPKGMEPLSESLGRDGFGLVKWEAPVDLSGPHQVTCQLHFNEAYEMVQGRVRQLALR